MGGVRVVKAFAQEERQLRRFNHAVARVFDQSMMSTRLRAFYSPLIGFIPQLGLAALLFVGGREAIRGSLRIGDFVAFYGYVLMLTSPMRMLGMALGMAQRAVASGARVFELLDRDPRLAAAPDARPLPAGGGRVELRGVSFAYEGGAPVLRDVSLDVEAGKHSGPGRAHGLGEDDAGDARAAALRLAGGRGARGRRGRPRRGSRSLRREVAVVSDDAFLFSAPLRENIAYARPAATEAEVLPPPSARASPS